MTATTRRPAPVGAPVPPTGPPAPRAGLAVLFAVYLVLLVWAVLWKLHVPWIGGTTGVKLVPFVATADAGASAPREVAANLVLFVPFGAYLGLLGPRRRWWAAVASALVVVGGTSTALEVTQYVLAVGRTDSTDVLVNTAGGLAGLVLVAVARRARAGRRSGRRAGSECVLDEHRGVVAPALGVAVGAPHRRLHGPSGERRGGELVVDPPP